MRETPIEDVWGIGRKYGKFLRGKGINTAYDFTQSPENFVQKRFSIVGLRLYKELKGECCLNLVEVIKKKKIILHSRSFGKYVQNVDGLEESVATFANKCTEKLRSQDSCASIVGMYIRTNPFNTKPQYYIGITMNFEMLTSNTFEIQQKVLWCLKQIYRKGCDYKKAGVSVMGIVNKDEIQGNLFTPIDGSKSRKISSLMDKLNAKFGKETITFAIQGKNTFWKGNASKISPKYITVWGDLLKVD